MLVISSAVSTSVITTIVIIILLVVSGMYYKYKKEREKRLTLEDHANRRKLRDFEDQFKRQEENEKKRGYFLAMCYFDDGVRYLLFVDEDSTVKQALENEGIYSEVTKLDWYASRYGEYSTDFHLLNDGFDWYIERNELYYATLGKPKKKHK